MAKRKGANSRKRRVFSNEEKNVYYRQWQEGYKDRYADNNLIAASQEYSREKKNYKHGWQHSLMKGYIAGLKAQLSDQKKGVYDYENHR